MSSKLRRRSARTASPLVVLGLAMSLLLAAGPVAGQTIVNIYQAKVAGGTATINALSTGAGNLVLSVKGLKASTSYAIALYSGGCSSVGSKIASFSSTTSTSAGAIKKTIAMTAGQVGAVRNAMNAQGAAVRLGTGSLVKCGALASIPIKVVSLAIGDVGRHGNAGRLGNPDHRTPSAPIDREARSRGQNHEVRRRTRRQRNSLHLFPSPFHELNVASHAPL